MPCRPISGSPYLAEHRGQRHYGARIPIARPITAFYPCEPLFVAMASGRAMALGVTASLGGGMLILSAFLIVPIGCCC